MAGIKEETKTHYVASFIRVALDKQEYTALVQKFYRE